MLIRAFAFEYRRAVTARNVDRAAHLVRLLRHDKKRALPILLVQNVQNRCRHELEDDRIQSLVPAEQNAGGNKDAGVDEQYDIK